MKKVVRGHEHLAIQGFELVFTLNGGMFIFLCKMFIVPTDSF